MAAATGIISSGESVAWRNNIGSVCGGMAWRNGGGGAQRVAAKNMAKAA